jgi:hypothetical protein
VTGPTTGLGALRRLSQPAPPTPAAEQVERCEFCAVAVDERHGHVADLNDHRLLCVCRPCYLLFGPQGAGGGRYRGVGEDVRVVEDLALEEVLWDALRIPVDLVFFFRQSSPEEPRGEASRRGGVDGLLSFYPGPGGATESELDLSAWSGICAANPVVDTLEPDVEAVLLRRHDEAFSCYLVPVDVCYELVGVVRQSWTGLGGGPEVWGRIADFFAGLDARAEAVPKTVGAA